MKSERLLLMLRGLPKGYIPKHLKAAAKVLDGLSIELNKSGFRYKEDEYWPYHILVVTSPGRYLSLFCSGFRPDIDVQQLKKDGTADTRFKERSFSTSKGVIRFLFKGEEKKK